MTNRRPPRRPRWVWPLSVALTTAGLLMLILAPGRFWAAIWPRGTLASRQPSAVPESLPLVAVELAPPVPSLSVVPDEADPPAASAVVQDPGWWTRGWNLRIDHDLGRIPVAADTLALAPWLVIWGSSASVERILAEPDSMIAARIWELVHEERLTMRDVDGVFTAIAKARAYCDYQRREAAMFDEFGRDQIRVPD